VARPGFRSTDLLPLVEAAIDKRAEAGHPLDRAIFLVGYNDVWRDALDDNRLGDLVEESARHECAVWLTIPVEPAGEPPAAGDFDPDLAEQLNEELAQLVEQHDNLHLVDDWARAIDDSASPGTYLEADGIHPNAEGEKLLAKTMYESIVSSCRFP
jgi:lysophospholipase L1-like esterase